VPIVIFILIYNIILCTNIIISKSNSLYFQLYFESNELKYAHEIYEYPATYADYRVTRVFSRGCSRKPRFRCHYVLFFLSEIQRCIISSRLDKLAVSPFDALTFLLIASISILFASQTVRCYTARLSCKVPIYHEHDATFLSLSLEL